MTAVHIRTHERIAAIFPPLAHGAVYSLCSPTQNQATPLLIAQSSTQIASRSNQIIPTQKSVKSVHS